MRIKRIYTFMLQTFLPIFVMTFAICIFIFMMQFLWKQVDEIVGKGLSLGVIAELFFYASMSFLPMALPLAVLLASLMTFGNLGDSLELLAMKASGISLLKIMRPLIIFVTALAIGAFFFQNDVMPKANTKMYSLLFGIKNKSPELEIPKGTFYKMETNSGDTYNIYVRDKNPKTGLLQDVTIYIFSGQNIEDATVTVADSARLQSMPDGNHLKLTLWQGEQVGTFKANNRQRRDDKHPQYRRESFVEKEVFIPYNNDLQRTDESMIASRHVGKNLEQLVASVDSLDNRIDSVNKVYSRQLVQRTYFSNVREEKRNDTLFFEQVAEKQKMPINLDSIYASLQAPQMAQISREAEKRSKSVVRSFDSRNDLQKKEYKERSLHEIEIHRKFTLSFGCLIFFFIGAALGAIIKKGGLGIPVIVSVVFFIIYFVIDNSGYKLARDGAWEPWAGVWLSSMVLAPVGIFLTWRAINDSTLFDWDAYKIFFTRTIRRVFGFLAKHGIVARAVNKYVHHAMKERRDDEAVGLAANPFRQHFREKFLNRNKKTE
ncbi:MAG: LptF/LptG family permease [Bacteroidales bacterium]|nr:LptF/LptG family permease [Bacteroidales bacterium]